METIQKSVPSCALKCLRNVSDVLNIVHPLKYGVNTIGRVLNNDIVLKNLSVSRTHCQLRVEKNGSKDIAYIKDLGTSNGTLVGNANLIEFEEHQLNDLDLIVLANDDEGVVLQFMDKVDQTIDLLNFDNNQLNYKRKIMCEENIDESTAVKVPKLVHNEPNIYKEPLLNENVSLSNESNNLPTKEQHASLNQPTLSRVILNSVRDSIFPTLPNDELKIASFNNPEPSCSYYKDKETSVQVKTEPDSLNNVLSQGTYRNEEDSIIVIYSSDEENNENGFEIPNIKIEQKQLNLSTVSTRNACSSTSNVEHYKNNSVWSIHCHKNNVISDNEDEIIHISPQSKLKSNKITNLISSNDSDSDSDYKSKCPKLIEPLPMVPKINNKKKKQTKLLSENENMIKTRAKSARKINIKKKTEEMTVDQNKKIIQERRIKLQQLVKNKNTLSSTKKKNSNDNSSANDNYVDEPSTIDKLRKKTRISKLQQNDNLNSVPSSSKSHLATDFETNEVLSIKNKAGFNSQKQMSHNDNQIVQLSSNCSDVGSSSTTTFNSHNRAYFETLSKICKWNAVWLREERFSNEPPPLVQSISKMKGTFGNAIEYSSIVQPLLLYEIWSKISDSYNMILNENPSFEKCIFFEKSLKSTVPFFTFDVKSVSKRFFQSVQTSKPPSELLWCLKCTETNKMNVKTFTGPTFSLKGYLCIAIIQSKNFETDTINVKTPKKSRNIFFAYVHTARKIGCRSSTQLCIDLIVTKKTENIPTGTAIHLMNIFYLNSELRLFQALNNVATSPLSNVLITPQFHNYNINYSKDLNYSNINSLMLNSSQKEAVKMAVSICLSKESNVGLIIGPPGTGKTNVICNIVLTLMSTLSTTTINKPKLLVCAPSNEAVDALVRRIIEIKKDVKRELQFNVVRVGNGQKYDPHSPINDVMLDNLVKQKMNNPQLLQSNSLSLFTNKKDLEKETLQNADVVVTTLNSCFSYRMEDAFMSSTDKKITSSHFTACIVDEAGQCVEPLNYVPLLLGIGKLILVGDDKQLQPVIKSKVAKDNGFGISLIKRLKTWFEHKRCTRKYFPITMLNTQYRMHHEINLFPSEYFYKGLVKTAPSVKARQKLSIQPYIILEHESQQDSSGEINIGEAYLILNLLDILMNSECKSLNIAILTPYHKQREQINLFLEQRKISLNVNTIDSFQGGECDILLISTVRTHGIGFLDDMCRLNVALTRSRQSLIICGNFMSLKGERLWCDLLENAKKRKLIKKVSNKIMSNPKVLFDLIRY